MPTNSVTMRSNATNTSDSHVTLSVTLWCRHLSLASCACFRGKIAVCGRACHCAGRLRTRRYSNATCVWFSRASGGGPLLSSLCLSPFRLRLWLDLVCHLSHHDQCLQILPFPTDNLCFFSNFTNYLSPSVMFQEKGTFNSEIRKKVNYLNPLMKIIVQFCVADDIFVTYYHV